MNLIKEKILKVFPKENTLGENEYVNLINNDLWDEEPLEVKRDFIGKSWMDLFEMSKRNHFVSGFEFLSVKARRYYMPYYLLLFIDSEDKNDIDCPFESIIFAWSGKEVDWAEYRKEMYGVMAKDEILCLAEFFKIGSRVESEYKEEFQEAYDLMVEECGL